MPPDKSPSRGGYDRDTFETELTALVERARTAGVDIQGAYDMRTGDDESPEYTIEVFEIAPRPFERAE